ncbi:MAG: tyrosine-type recombinase/integrase [Flavisolibacter sp.]
MFSITLRVIYHQGKESIGIFYGQDQELEKPIRRISGIRWNGQHNCWCLPLNKTCYQQILDSLPPQARIDATSLKGYLEKRKQYTDAKEKEPVSLKPVSYAICTGLCLENLKALALFVRQLKLKAYSPSTIRTYRGEFLQLLQVLKNKPAASMTQEDIKRYMMFAIEKQGIGEHTAHSRLNALKFYFEQVLGRERFFLEIPRPKKPFQLPNVLNERELERLFAALPNLKHKALLFTAYSAGLRVSEVVHLKLTDIDSGRMQIRIEQAKGKKDRYVGLSLILLDVLRAYLKLCQPRPQTYLFEGERKGEPYTIRSAQLVFQQARAKAGIQKQVSFHALRHSFATHLLEKGIDIKYIKDLLGHFSIKTTERYLHVKRRDLTVLVNPLDELYKGKTWKK